MLSLQYRVKFGRKMNWNNPRRFTEKLQWYKLYYRTPLMAQCADKLAVREFVKNCGLDRILNRILFVYDTPEEIHLNELPEKFVLKDTLGCGGNSVLICTDKSKITQTQLQTKAREWLNESKKGAGREWIYEKGISKIIAEAFIEPDSEALGLVDYKFHCFNGKVKILQVIAERNIGVDAAFAYYTTDFQRLPYSALNERKISCGIDKPNNYDALIAAAEKLAEPFPYVRVDLYNVRENILFGEITFFDASGYHTFEPDEFDFILGDCFVLPEESQKR
jgi:hypothetical protein